MNRLDHLHLAAIQNDRELAALDQIEALAGARLEYLERESEQHSGLTADELAMHSRTVEALEAVATLRHWILN